MPAFKGGLQSERDSVCQVASQAFAWYIGSVFVDLVRKYFSSPLVWPWAPKGHDYGLYMFFFHIL